MDQPPPVTLVVIDSTACLLAENIHHDTALTVIALVSEDPADWAEAMGVWPRYRTPTVFEFVSSVPLEPTDRTAAIEALHRADGWAVVDFVQKRLLTGGPFQEIGRNATFGMQYEKTQNRQHPLCIHLPPWWEIEEEAHVDQVTQPRQSPINPLRINREILYGKPFIEFIADQLMSTVQSEPWRASDAATDQSARYPFTVAVHRDWLTTPRQDLNDQTPRQSLHGAIDWIDNVTWGQRRRFDKSERLIAAPDDWVGYENAPMGSQERVLYYDLCREIIAAGWFWLMEPENRQMLAIHSPPPQPFIGFLEDVKNDWWRQPFEGGAPPSFIIECDRRRVPIGAGVEIEGIEGVQDAEHIIDCDCPICELIAAGIMGVSFSSLTGDGLELDEDFVFSGHETLEAWEEDRREYAEMSASIDRREAEQNAASEGDDELLSAWSGAGSPTPIPGDIEGQLQMAFMVAEIISELQAAEADHDEIIQLNANLARYRQADDADRRDAAAQLKSQLRILAESHPRLVARTADLQSRIDEATRRRAFGFGKPDVPF